ncbi:MAG: hypothetical protein ACE5NG_12035 [bacterium]
MKTKAARKSHFYSILIISLCSISPLFSQSVIKRVGEVKYISKHTYYINLGTKQGLGVGDRVTVKRKNQTIGALVVEHVARLSSSCRLVFQKAAIKQGDRVEIFVGAKNKEANVESSEVQKTQKSKPVTSSSTSKSRITQFTKQKKNSVNRIKGRLGIQSLWFDNMSGSNLNYKQLAFRTKLTVERFMGLPVELRFHWRSRIHIRERSWSTAISDNEWTHSIYELSLVYENKNSPLEFGLGRILSRRIRGLGYIDGGLFSVKMNGTWRIGVAGGTQPSLRGAYFQAEEQKFGVFLNFEQGEYRTQRFSSTIAFSGRYHGGEVSREFVYLQNNFWNGSKFSIYHTIELDLNRGWKHDHSSSSLQFSNFFLTMHYSPINFVSLTLSYDARKNIRIYETRSIPDSLFDETTRQGLHSGITLQLSKSIRFSANVGMRFRKGNLKNTTSASAALSIRHIFNTWATLNARFSYFSTMFTKGYRPNANIRIPVLRGLSVNLAGGSYIYQTGSRTSSSHWMEVDSHFRINRWLFGSFGYRAFFDDRLRSGRLFVETGVTF